MANDPERCRTTFFLVTEQDFDRYMSLKMRGLSSFRVDSASRREADEKHYVRRMKEIIEEFPNKGPPFYPTQLSPVLFIGSQRNADDLATLERIGITHVVNCAGTRRYDMSRSPYHPETGIRDYLMIPAEDNDEFSIQSYFKEAITFINRAKYSAGKVLVHCNLGVNRSGAICAAYLLVDLKMTLLEVITFLKIKRSVVLYNRGFRRQLYRYARSKSLLDPVIGDQASCPKGGQYSQQKSNSTGHLERSKPPPLPAGVSLDSATMRTSSSTSSFISSGTKKFGSKLFKKYGRSLSNSVVEDEIGENKTKPREEKLHHDSSSIRSRGEEPGESRFARSFLTLPRRSTSTFGSNSTTKGKMDPLPENLSVQKFTDKSSSAGQKRRIFKEKRASSLDKNEDLVETYQDTGFSTTLLPGTRLREKAAEAPVSPKSLSTSRPLRVYKRSATDSEVYRSRRSAGAGRLSSGQGADATRTPRSPGSENNLDKISRDLTAFSFDPKDRASRSQSGSDSRPKAPSKWISAE